ncbi:ethanolamine phosphotransferase [Angomonas deanei]|nr:ethanolamine phosphotransferase [Angomonas deanei]|eukprot:EPY41276.1 ethanolamine phosphotransferase [Angomonas deanei]
MPLNAAFDPPKAVLPPISWVLPAGAPTPPVTPLHPTRIEPVVGGRDHLFLFYSVCAILYLTYCVADNTDGRLARRDRKTSVIGEYLDHGLDCVTSLLSACVAFCVMGCTMCNMSISVCMVAFVTILSHTLHYELNTFVWGTRLATVDEAMIFFGVCLWIALACPFLATDRPLSLTLLQGLPLIGTYCPTTLLNLASLLTYNEWIYIFYNITQFSTILGVAARRWSMLLRLPTLFVAVNTAVLLSLLPSHSALAAAHPPVSRTAVTTTQFGPFQYPAVWMITAASTFSVIVHVVIMAKCAHFKAPDFLPLAGLVFVWFAFVSCPVGGMLLAVLLHVVQVKWNVGFLRQKNQ